MTPDCHQATGSRQPGTSPARWASADVTLVSDSPAQPDPAVAVASDVERVQVHVVAVVGVGDEVERGLLRVVQEAELQADGPVGQVVHEQRSAGTAGGAVDHDVGRARVYDLVVAAADLLAFAQGVQSSLPPAWPRSPPSR